MTLALSPEVRAILQARAYAVADANAIVLARAVDFRRVYQGGHHDVWCDGALHAITAGGFVHTDRLAPGPTRSPLYKCDCERYGNKMYPENTRPGRGLEPATSHCETVSNRTPKEGTGI